MELNDSNYYSIEADREYMSYSQYKGFLKCEEAAMAKLSGWQPPKTTALLVGSYVHAAIEGMEAAEKFKKDNPGIFTKSGELKAEFRQAEAMIQTVKSDRLMQISLEGQKEVILTGEYAGARWKCKLDNLNVEKGFFSDLKTCANLSEKVWDNENLVYVSFIEAYGYIGQMALYREIARQKFGQVLNPFLSIVTKETPPDKIVTTLHPDRLDDELIKIKKRMPRILDVKSGNAEPEPCGKCAYCRENKKLSRVYDYDEIF